MTLRDIADWILEQEGDNLYRFAETMHEAMDWCPLFWQIWWRIGYRWAYPYMWRARFRGCRFAQWFGGELDPEGDSWLRWRFVESIK